MAFVHHRQSLLRSRARTRQSGLAADEAVSALSVEWDVEPEWEAWAAFQTVESVPKGSRANSALHGPLPDVSATSYPLV